MQADTPQQNLPPLLQSLCRPEIWPHPVGHIRVIETHVSWIVLTGEFAYKIKQPLDLGFLDFSTLEKRRVACEAELRLNRRFAPDLYLAVVAIAGSEDEPKLAEDDDASIIEYAVRMREFPQEHQLDRLLTAGALEMADMDELAETVASISKLAPVAEADSAWGSVPTVAGPALDNLTAIEPVIEDADDRNTLNRLREWTTTQVAMLGPRMERRRTDGHIREGHGDLHLANLTRFDDRIVAFDCIEFDPALRWRDTMSDVSFLVMDLAVRQRFDLAWRFLNRYLEITGDYSGAALLRFYIVYASLVRAKIAAIRARQEPPGSDEFAGAARRFRKHLGLAERAIRPRLPAILLTTGLSGSGKTWLSSRLCSVLPAIRIRSDIERKRLHGMTPDERSDSEIAGGLYSSEATDRTYGWLRDRASDLLAARLDVIVDASFLQHRHRSLFLELARDSGASLVLLDCRADEAILRERVAQRQWDGADASEADQTVLAHQQAVAEPLTSEEQALAITVDTGRGSDPLRIAGQIWRKLGRETAD